MSVPVINIAAMRDWETATWASGQTENEVIQRVGKRIARRARKLTDDDDLILILAGKGHNGDDARAAKSFLDGRRVKVLDLILPDTDLLPLHNALSEKPALIIDGLFGIGLDRPLAESWRSLITTVNASKIPVLSVDVPSGLNADTGEAFGAAVEAQVTLAVGAPKTGLLADIAWPYVGRLEVTEDVGLVPCPLTGDVRWTQREDFQNFPPSRPVAGHKGTFGHVAVLAGSLGYHGAAVLATRGAQRAQPGLTTLYTQQNIYGVIAPHLQSAMVHTWTYDTKLPETVTGLLVGPGIVTDEAAESVRRSLNHWWRDFDHPVVVDASGLDILSAGPSAKKSGRILTPHPGELSRLINWPTPKVQANRVAALRELSRRYGNCWVVLKGHQTLVGQSEGEVFVNSSGNPCLAQGGSGDLLAGFIAGLLAQPALQEDLGATLRYAVWQHGAAADKLQASRTNWIIEDLADEIGNAH